MLDFLGNIVNNLFELLTVLVGGYFTFQQFKVKSRVSDLEVKALTDEEKINKLEIEVNRLTNRVKHDTQLVAGLDKRCEIQQKEIDELTEKLHEYKSELEKKNSENKSLRRRIIVLEKELKKLKNPTK